MHKKSIVDQVNDTSGQLICSFGASRAGGSDPATDRVVRSTIQLVKGIETGMQTSIPFQFLEHVGR